MQTIPLTPTKGNQMFTQLLDLIHYLNVGHSDCPGYQLTDEEIVEVLENLTLAFKVQQITK